MLFLGLFSVFALSCVKSQAPIPSRITGWSYDPNGTGFDENAIEVEVFFDLLCPDCLMAWKGLKEMANYYGQKVRKN